MTTTLTSRLEAAHVCVHRLQALGCIAQSVFVLDVDQQPMVRLLSPGVEFLDWLNANRVHVVNLPKSSYVDLWGCAVSWRVEDQSPLGDEKNAEGAL